MMKREPDNTGAFWTILVLIIIALMINTGSCRGQAKPEGYFAIAGGWADDELVFDASAIGTLGPIAGRFQYFYSNPKELFSLGIGPKADLGENVDVMLFFGSELNNDFHPKIALLSHVRITDGTSIQVGAESVRNELYLNLGLVVKLQGISLDKPKPRRFF